MSQERSHTLMLQFILTLRLTLMLQFVITSMVSTTTGTYSTMSSSQRAT
jgi:hypothetical protein